MPAPYRPQDAGPRPQNAPINPARGERHGRAKLTEEIVREIRRRYRWFARVDGGAALAREFDIDPKTVQAIVNGRTWTHVTARAA